MPVMTKKSDLSIQGQDTASSKSGRVKQKFVRFSLLQSSRGKSNERLRQ